jgi:hypothetical protein
VAVRGHCDRVRSCRAKRLLRVPGRVFGTHTVLLNGTEPCRAYSEMKRPHRVGERVALGAPQQMKPQESFLRWVLANPPSVTLSGLRRERTPVVNGPVALDTRSDAAWAASFRVRVLCASERLVIVSRVCKAAVQRSGRVVGTHRFISARALAQKRAEFFSVLYEFVKRTIS